jgi:LuxR family maltose regulon positive regulatory protein
MPIAGRQDERLDAATAMKIRMPHRSHNVITRPRLMAALDQVAGSPAAPPTVALVTGAAGTGKTTLLAEWAATRTDDTIAWVTVDQSDGVTSLWKAILAAVRQAGAHPRPEELAGLVVPKDTVDAGFVAEVARLLADCVRPMWIVLDEVEHLTDMAATRSVDLLLRWMSEPVRVVMAGRSEPPVALHRLRLDGRLVEIRERDLAFSAEHTAQLLAGHGVRLDEPDLAVLVRRTEGWAAAVRLAAISLEGADDPGRLVADFAGDERAVADYLVGEILAGQSEEVRDFLLRTCVCDEICPDLARTTADREDAGALLADLARRNALTVELGEHAGWYRYHTLLISYLRAELSRRSPALWRELHAAAATWFAANGEPVRAYEHAVMAGDAGQISDLARGQGLGAVLAGHAAEICRITATLPGGLAVDPWIMLVTAAAALDRGAAEEADAWLRRVPATGLDPRAEALRAVVVLARARVTGDYRTELAALAETVAGDSGDPDLDLMALVERGTAALWLDRLDDADRDLAEAVHRAEADGRDHVVLRCMTMRAAVSAAGGDLVGMGARSAEALAFAGPRGWARTGMCAAAYVQRGYAAYLGLDDKRAREDGLLAVELAGLAAEPVIRYSATAFELLTRFETGDDPHTAAVKAGRLWPEFGQFGLARSFVAYTSVSHYRMCALVGETELARGIARTTRERLGDCGEVSLLEALALVHRGRGGEARRAIAPVLAHRTECVVPITLVSCLLLEAALAEITDGQATAQRALAEALHVAEPLGALRPFQDGGEVVRKLLAAGIGRFGRAEPFAARLRAHLRPDAASVTRLLTDRERDVLAELPSMRTADEIADDLFVSTSTIKTHMRSIYRKLGVPNRRSAVTEARRHGLL